jgi:hypothetical protein
LNKELNPLKRFSQANHLIASIATMLQQLSEEDRADSSRQARELAENLAGGWEVYGIPCREDGWIRVHIERSGDVKGKVLMYTIHARLVDSDLMARIGLN